MIPTLVPAIWSGVFLLALAGVGHTRWRGIWAMFLLALSVATALYLGAVRIQDGAWRETSFSKNDGFSTPSGQRTIVTGRSRRCGSITSATAR